MPKNPEQEAREAIDRMLLAAGWEIQDADRVNVSAQRGVAIREFPLKSGHGEADYLLYVDSNPVGVVEAKKVGDTLTGVEIQTEKYSVGLPNELRPPRSPLPFLYQSTGVETRFTSLLDPGARSRPVFSFHQPATLGGWLDKELKQPGSTLRARLKHMPELLTGHLWPAQIRAIQGLERSLAQDRPRSLIQMATGSGKTFTACNFVYRLVKEAGARRVLFLVDRGNLGRQTLKEFQGFTTPDDGRKFTELYNVQLMQSNKLDPVAKVCITTIQRLYSMLKGESDFDPGSEEESAFLSRVLENQQIPVEYNAAIPPETFDVIVTDECHRSIYNLWRQVLEYFDGYLIGLTATPSKQTFGFFNQNLVMEYNHAQAVADGVNVDFDVYRISTAISERGSVVEAGFHVDKRDRETRAKRWEKLDEPLAYGASQLDRDVVAPDQIRTIIQAFRDRLPTEIFPGRTEVPKTLIFAKDDSHADDIVQIVREEFGKGNEFCEKITYRTGTVRVVNPNGSVVYKNIAGIKAEDLLSSFRNSYHPRIVVTVDMIATGTDVKPLEIVFFLRSVKSRNLFEQMKGRGVRVVSQAELQQATPDAEAKQRFVIVDAVGICEQGLSDTFSLDRKPTASLKKLLQAVAFGNRESDVLSSIASRLARLDRQLGPEERGQLESASGGEPISSIASRIVDALDPDRQIDAACEVHNTQAPTDSQVEETQEKLLEEAAKPLAANPELRSRILEVKRAVEQTIDTVSRDELTEAGYSEQAREKAQTLVQSFQQFITEHKDEITALQVLYSRPYAQRLTYKEIRELAEAIKTPPRGWTPEQLWRAYETLDRTKVRGSGRRTLADIVSLVRFALGQEDELHPFRQEVERRFDEWMAGQESGGRKFTPEQREWLAAIRDHVAESVAIGPEDFEYAPFEQRGGLGRAYQVFGKELNALLDELNGVLAA
jgi:type I restriction enzyme R subunit